MKISRKLLFLAIAFLILAALILTLFHFHADGHHPDCPVCRLIQHCSLIIILAAAALTTDLTNRKNFSIQTFPFFSLLLSSSLQDRAPPFLS